MIEYIQLRNFQSHKETEMEFHPGVNAIVGESDNGKSAIMRAFYWLAFGKPAGDSFRRHGAKNDTEVTIETDTHQIARIRGNTINKYIATTFDEDVDGVSHTGFGQNVPEPISTILNVNEINFMRQLDPPFLFSKTAGEVAQYLNRLINLDVIDISLSNIKRMHSQSFQAADSHNREVQRLEHELLQYAWVDDADADIAKLEKREAKLLRLERTAEELDKFLDDVDGMAELLGRLTYTEQISKSVQRICTTHEHIGKSVSAYNTLSAALSQVNQCAIALHKVPAVKGAEKAILALEKRVMAHNKALSTKWHLEECLQQIGNKWDNLQDAIAEHKRSVALLQKAMPNVCPLCDQEIQ